MARWRIRCDGLGPQDRTCHRPPCHAGVGAAFAYPVLVRRRALGYPHRCGNLAPFTVRKRPSTPRGRSSHQRCRRGGGAAASHKTSRRPDFVGFQFQAPFQDAFFYLPPTAKAIELLVLCLTNTIGGCTGASSPGSARTKRLGQLFAARDGERNRWRMGDKKLARFADAKRLLFPDRGLRIPNGWNAAPDEQFLKGADKFREATNSLASL